MADDLLTAEGRELVAALTPYDATTALARIGQMRRDPRWAGRPELVAAAATQARLRTRAMSRFPGPPRWWTADGLEQATRPALARRHAQRFADAGVRHVADLGCGAGSDALALAAAGLQVEALDLDPGALWALAASAADLGVELTTRHGDVRLLDAWWNRPSLDSTRGVFVDPARRRGGARTLAPEAWSPPWSWVRALAERIQATGAKVAPGIDHAALPTQAQAEWVSIDGDLLEAAVWWGPLRAGAARRVATVIRHPGIPRVTGATPAGGWANPAGGSASAVGGANPVGGSASADAAAESVSSLDDSDGVPVASTGPVSAWLVEPDPAVIRAGLVALVAERLGGHLLDPRIAYVATDVEPGPTALGTAFDVVDEVPFGRKPMRAWLRSRGYGDVVVKKRGIDVVPEELRAALRLGGDGPTATLVLTRTDSGPLALLVRRA